MSTPKQIYIAWVEYQRRPTSMSDYFGYHVRFIPTVFARWVVFKILFGYPWQALLTAWIILTQRPGVIWIQMPPNFLAHLCLFLRLAYSRNRPVLVADLHNSALAAPWLSVPFTRRLLQDFDLVLVHNETMRIAAAHLGIDERNLHVLEDRSPSFGDGALHSPHGRPCFVMPCSFYKDEPVGNVIEAARLMPDYDFMITGPRIRAEGRGLVRNVPGNVTFTDFMPVAEYDALVGRASAILCLTTMDGIQLSAASEAVGAGKPMIVSDMPLLRNLFEAGYFVDNSVEALHEACRAVAANYPRYAALTVGLRDDAKRNRRWQAQAAPIRDLLTAEPNGSHA